MQFELETGQGKHRIRLIVIMTDDGINVLLTGGDKAHVGGVVLSVPRKSLTGFGASCDAWVVPVPGHKDVIAAEKVGTVICRATGEAVAVTAGIHIDNALPEDLELVMKNCLEGARMAANRCVKHRAGTE